MTEKVRYKTTLWLWWEGPPEWRGGTYGGISCYTLSRPIIRIERGNPKTRKPYSKRHQRRLREAERD